jgi:hydrogenase maturation protease
MHAAQPSAFAIPPAAPIPAPRTLVVGLGNILLADEGIGVHAVRRLLDENNLPAGVEVIDGGTCGMDLISDIADADRLLVIDAARTGRAPGTVLTVSGEALPAFFTRRLSPHQAGFTDMLATLDLLGRRPPDIILIAIEPEDLSLCLDMSETGKLALEEVMARVRAELAVWRLRDAGLTEGLR